METETTIALVQALAEVGANAIIAGAFIVGLTRYDLRMKEQVERLSSWIDRMIDTLIEQGDQR